MNILFLSRLYEPHVGGVEKHIRELSKVLMARGHKIKLITVKHDPALPDYEVLQGIEVYRMPTAEKFAVWRWLFKNRGLIMESDLVHIHDVFYWYLPFCYLKKSFMTFHGYEGAHAPKWKQIFWHRLAAKLTAGNICIGDFHKKWYGVRPDFVSYGAVYPTKVGYIHSRSYKSAIFIGRDHPDTGLEAYRKLAKTQNIKLTEYIDVPNAARFLPKYDIAFVSRYLAILEALVAGVPVLAHFNNAIKHDYLQLAPFAAFIQTFTDPQNVDLSFKYVKEGQKWAKLQTWEKLADTYETLWAKK